MLYIKSEKEYIQIVEEFSDMIFRIVYQNLYHIDDSEGVVQDVFLKLLKQKLVCCYCTFFDFYPFIFYGIGIVVLSVILVVTIRNKPIKIESET